jgi:GT2 family glycosyltransferase
MKVAVVILNWNGKQDTLDCLQSLQACKGELFDVIVVDNGSTDGSAEVISAAFKQITLIETGANLGFAGGNNVGIERAFSLGADAVLLLNNDTVVDPYFIQAFIDDAQKAPQVGIWGGYPIRYYDRTKLDHLGGVWNPSKADFDLVGLHAPIGYKTEKPLDYVCGCSIFIRKEVFQKIGLLETRFFLYWEEADFAMRAKKAGFEIKVSWEAILYHKVSASFENMSLAKKYFWWRGRLLWIERNCPIQEQQRILKKIIQPELYHYKKLYLLKQAQLAVLKLFKKKNLEQKEAKLKQHQAVLQGISDFFSKKFGPAPSWLYRS